MNTSYWGKVVQIEVHKTVSPKAFTVDYGYYQDNGIQVIVTSGAGTWGPPIRIGTKSEIVEILLSIV